MSACASSSIESETDSAPPAANQQADITQQGTGGALIAIDSDNVELAGYDLETRVMTVLFDSARAYEYYDVPPELWRAFVAAQPDPWSLVGYPELVKGGYAYREILP